MGAKIVGTGSYLPRTVLSNEDLARTVDTSDEWIVERTGIRTRHLLAEGEEPSSMAIGAAKAALARATVQAKKVDLLVVADNFPDMVCPGTSPFVAAGLGLAEVPFFDLHAGCTGFLYALVVANALVSSGTYGEVLVVGSEALSRVTDWSDRSTCVLFGDGAGAVLLEPGGAEEGVLASALHADPTKALLLRITAGGTRTPATRETVERGEHYLRMEGQGVFRSAVGMMERSTREALAKAGMVVSDVDWVIPHQANLRIIDSLLRRLDVPRERVLINVDRVANTSTASIPIALDEGLREGKIEPGHVVVLTAFGAGATYGAVVLRI